MIRLTFKHQNELMHFLVKGREIHYMDKVFKHGIRCIPKDEAFIQKIRNSRNKYSPKLIAMFTLSKRQEDEYHFAKTEDDLAFIIINDCTKKGLQLISKEVL